MAGGQHSWRAAIIIQYCLQRTWHAKFSPGLDRKVFDQRSLTCWSEEFEVFRSCSWQIRLAFITCLRVHTHLVVVTVHRHQVITGVSRYSCNTRIGEHNFNTSKQVLFKGKGKGKGRILAIALLTWVRLVTRSALQSRKWQLIGMRWWYCGFEPATWKLRVR